MIGFNPAPKTRPPVERGNACLKATGIWPKQLDYPNIQINCPNCGAPVDRSRCRCAYCGTPYTGTLDSELEKNVQQFEEEQDRYDYGNQMVMVFKDGAMQWVRDRNLPKPIPTVETY